MKFTDNLIKKFGVDKLLHFLVAAWVVAELKIYGVAFGCLGFIAILILAFAKEKWFDKEFSAEDFWYSACGGFASLALLVLKESLSCL